MAQTNFKETAAMTPPSGFGGLGIDQDGNAFQISSSGVKQSFVVGIAPITRVITNVDLDSGDNYSYTETHNNNTMFVEASLLDNNGNAVSLSGIFQVVDVNSVKITLNHVISGDWYLMLRFL